MTVAVIGGGASGLMAALTAARAGAQVLLLERQSRVGRKLLATGNGRCNLSNLDLHPGRYHGAPPDFLRPALDAFPPQAALDFFRGLGLLTVSEPDGRVYPLSDQAGSVVDVLRLAVDEAGVRVRTQCDVTALTPEGAGFALYTGEGERLEADKVVVCCGGMAGGKVGGSNSGCQLLHALGHPITKLYPALVQLKTDTAYVRALKGVRADALATLLREGEEAQSGGEVQFTEYGVSGPAIFALSRAMAGGGEATLRLDLLRELAQDEVEALVARRAADMPGLSMENLLTGMVHNRLGRTVLRYAGYELAAPVTALAQKDFRKIARALKGFTLPVLGTLGFDAAQVTAGGADAAHFRPESLESRLVPGLYAAGEVLDVDGDCGGFNLHWAWASGRLAGLTK